MSDDRGPDDFGEYGSLFDDSPSGGVVPSPDVGGFEERIDQNWDDDVDDGIGDLTWADDLAEQEQGTNGATGSPLGLDPPVSSETNVFGVDDISTGHPAPPMPDDQSDVDVWSTFSSDSPNWRSGEAGMDFDADPSADSGHARRVVIDGDDYSDGYRTEAEARTGDVAPDRISIGTDPSAGYRRDGNGGRDPGGRDYGRGRRPDGAARTQLADSGGRDLPMAVGVGIAMAAVFFAVLYFEPLKYWGVVAVVTLVVGIAAFEFYTRVAEKGYRPAVIPGIATCAALPLAAYWMGDSAIPLVITFGFLATATSFIGARSADAGPMPNVSITSLGIVWIGLLGSFAMLILRFSTANATDVVSSVNYGTDTLFLLALGVVVNDTGALVVGSFVGRTPLRQWISPNKTVEGLIGGSAFTILAMVVYKTVGDGTTWTTYPDLILLAVVISVMAPLGDLVESMFKRNMEIKDFGSIVRGHGGVLDRFDGFLFALPAVYYLTEVLQPWTKAG